jgi:hypothetical protein
LILTVSSGADPAQAVAWRVGCSLEVDTFTRLGFAFHKHHIVIVICIVTFLADKVEVAFAFSSRAVSARGEVWGVQPLGA